MSCHLDYFALTHLSSFLELKFGEPPESLEGANHYDVYSAPWEAPTIDLAIKTGMPALTGPFKLLDTTLFGGYSVLLYHPGIELPEKFHTKPKDLSGVVVNLGKLLNHAAKDQASTLSVFLYDSTTSYMDPSVAPQFLAGAEIVVGASPGNPATIPNAKDPKVTLYNETDYISIEQDTNRLKYQQTFDIGGRQWLIIVLPVEGTYETNLNLIITLGVMIFVSTLLLAVWMMHNMYQSIAIHRVISKAAAEAAIVANLFPPNVRDRMIQDAQLKGQRDREKTQMGMDVFVAGEDEEKRLQSKTMVDSFLTSEGIFGSKPIAELYPYTTLVSAIYGETIVAQYLHNYLTQNAMLPL